MLFVFQGSVALPQISKIMKRELVDTSMHGEFGKQIPLEQHVVIQLGSPYVAVPF